MKKNKLLIILITILFLPFSINAVVRNNYDITKENTNLYINDFSRNNIYIIKNTSSFNVPFIYNNGTLSVDTYFKNGGLLNILFLLVFYLALSFLYYCILPIKIKLKKQLIPFSYILLLSI